MPLVQIVGHWFTSPSRVKVRLFVENTGVTGQKVRLLAACRAVLGCVASCPAFMDGESVFLWGVLAEVSWGLWCAWECGWNKFEGGLSYLAPLREYLVWR